MYNSPKVPPFHDDTWPPNSWFPGPYDSTAQTTAQSVRSFQHSSWFDQRTHRHTYYAKSVTVAAVCLVTTTLIKRLNVWKDNMESNTRTHPFNGPLSGTTQLSRYQKGKTNLDFTEARDSEWQWHQLGHIQVFTSLRTGIHTSIPPLSFLQAGWSSCRPTNSVKALKAGLMTNSIA